MPVLYNGLALKEYHWTRIITRWRTSQIFAWASKRAGSILSKRGKGSPHHAKRVRTPSAGIPSRPSVTGS